MGLDTSHDCWHGAYSSFNRWREAVAVAAGYAVYDVADHRSGRIVPTVMLDWGHIMLQNLLGDWEKPPHDPLIVLIAHSDCEGFIHPEHAGPLADRLEELLPLLNDDPIIGHQAKTRQFIAGLRAAVAAGEAVDFH